MNAEIGVAVLAELLALSVDLAARAGLTAEQYAAELDRSQAELDARIEAQLARTAAEDARRTAPAPDQPAA